MGCGCKNKQDVKETKQLKKEIQQNVKIISSVTLEEILIIENMMNDINTNVEKRGVIIEFVERNFDETIMSYCDQVCQNRIKQNLKKLKESL
jgi:hypothetical protein